MSMTDQLPLYIIYILTILTSGEFAVRNGFFIFFIFDEADVDHLTRQL